MNAASTSSDFFVVQANVGQATTSVRGIVALATSTEAEAKSDSNKAITSSSLTNFPVKKTFTIGDGTATTFACTHSLGSKNVSVSVRRAGDDVYVFPGITATSTSITTIEFSTAPTTNAYIVTIIG